MKWSKETVYSVECEGCGKTDSVYSGDSAYRNTDTPKKFFKREGWGVKAGMTLCSECMRREM